MMSAGHVERTSLAWTPNSSFRKQSNEGRRRDLARTGSRESRGCNTTPHQPFLRSLEAFLILSSQLSALSSQLSTLNPQPSTLNVLDPHGERRSPTSSWGMGWSGHALVNLDESYVRLPRRMARCLRRSRFAPRLLPPERHAAARHRVPHRASRLPDLHGALREPPAALLGLAHGLARPPSSVPQDRHEQTWPRGLLHGEQHSL